jgi:hypothetical protein
MARLFKEKYCPRKSLSEEKKLSITTTSPASWMIIAIFSLGKNVGELVIKTRGI